MLGTDYPFDMGVTDPVERAAAAGLPAADLTAILSGNAATLFGLAQHSASDRSPLGPQSLAPG
jgi:aminocarboxymuconate-semialdehyde decarboxylase